MRVLLCLWMTERFWAVYQFNSVAQSCLTVCNPTDCSVPGFPVHHQLPELAQTHVHRVGDAVQPSHPLSSPSPPAFNLSQHQGLFQWVSSLHQVATVLELQLQHHSSDEYSGLISFRIEWLDLVEQLVTGWNLLWSCQGFSEDTSCALLPPSDTYVHQHFILQGL